MNLIRTVIEIRYKEAASKFNFLDGIIVALGGNPPKSQNKPSITSGVSVITEGKKISTTVEAKRLSINIEDRNTGAVTHAIDAIEKVNRHLNWGLIERVGVRTFWIKEALSFEDVSNRVRQKFLAHNALIDGAEDLGISLIINNDSRKINLNTGPMNREQVIKQQLLTFPGGELVPESFVFVDTDYYEIFKTQSYSSKFLKEFVAKALEVSEGIARDTSVILEI